MEEVNEQVTLNEFLVKTSYQTQITEPTDRKCSKPVSFGSGFIVEYDDTKLFVTADHTVHLDDYENDKEERTGKDYIVSIFNNYTPPGNFLSTVVTPLGGFYYMEKFHLDKPIDAPELVDVSICKMKALNFQFPFLTDEVSFPEETIKAKQEKFSIKKECFSDPVSETNYFVYGKVRTKLVETVRLESIPTIKQGLRFISQAGDYLLFNYPEIIGDRLDWEGLSGSAVISEDGECVGVLCSVYENSKSVYVMPVSKVKMLIEVVIQEEQLRKENA